MANNPKKMQDPAESALTAIQEALGTAERPAGRPAATPQEPAVPYTDRRASVSADKDLFEGVGPSLTDDQPPARRAANDDRQSIGMILQTLQRHPPRTSYLVATAFAFAWVLGGLILAFLYLPDLQAAATQGKAGIPAMIGLGALVLAPVMFFYALAHMVWRSQELRLIAQSMAGVAMRLAEPEEVARESIVTVGQAIRREVAAMGDGVERALARAAELEALVANEVASLERAYHDNEVRIRGLLETLAHQRDTLVSQGEQVRHAITSVHLDLTNDIASVSDHVAHRVNDSAQKIVHALTEKGEHITLALGRAGDFMIGALGERGGDLLERLERTSQETTEAIATASDRLTSSLNFKTDHITEEFSELTNNLSIMMETRLDDVTQGFAQKSSAIVQLMEERSQTITDTVLDTSSRLAETIVTRGDEVNNTLKSTGDSIVLDLSLRGSDVVTKLEQTGATVGEAFRVAADALATSVAGHSDTVRELLAARLQAFEQMFSAGGTELTEKIARDSTTLGNLITRHVAEFDRTVKTYGGELVERLGQRTQEVSEAMRTYVDTFDSKVSTKASEVTVSLDQRLSRFQDALDSRTQTLNEALSSRVMDIAKTLAEGGKEVVAALDRRIGDVTTVINSRGEELASTIGNKIHDIDQALGSRAMEVANTLDTRIGRFEQLLVGRAETVTEQIEVRTRAAADALNARMEHLASSIQTNSAEAERAIAQVTGNAERMLSEASSKTERVLNEASSKTERVLAVSASNAERVFTAASENTERVFATATENADRAFAVATENAARVMAQASSAAERIIGHAGSEAERTVAAVSTGVSTVLKQNATDVERTLLGVSAEVARSFVGKADEISAQVSARAADMTRILDTNSSTLLAALTSKSREFTGEISKATDQAVRSIEAQGFSFTRTMMDNSEQIARLVNEASENATGAVNLTLNKLRENTQAAIEQSTTTAKATVSEMLETHSMVRSDTTTLFERLREANILLQEVLSGAHLNMSALENTLVTRVSEFVATMNEVAERSGVASNQVDQHITAFHTATSKVLGDLGQLAGNFEQHGRSLAEAVALIDQSNRRTEETFGERRATIEQIVATLDSKTEDIEHRLKRFSSLLDETLEGASGRARDIARLIAESSEQGLQSMEQERERTGEAMRSLFGQHATETEEMLGSTTQRFTDLLQGIRQMAGDMQREMETTRTELRRGILELPQETAESAAQMRRVIVDQIEALAELNRIVARHGRGMDAAEPARRQETAAASAGARLEPPRFAEPPRAEPPRMEPPRAERPAPRPDITGQAPLPRRQAESPSLSPAQGQGQPGGNGRSGWLSELLHRASRPDDAPPLPDERAARPSEPRAAHYSIESLDSLSVDIARMIDHDAAAELWDRYKRGERNVFTRRLYTLQGQKTFDEIRRKYRADRDFRQTVDRYIGEFERLLEEVSRDDRGQVVTRTYLTSETGKVYTMLAHAAGRFGE